MSYLHNLLPIVLTIGIFGCDSQSERRPVAGTVTVDGAKIQHGSISFFPEQGHTGPAASTSISAGQYQFVHTNGPTPGPHRVIVGIETQSEGIKPDLQATSANAKRGPGNPMQTSPRQMQPMVNQGGQTQWQTRADVSAADMPNSDLPIDFAFQSNTASTASPTLEPR